MSNPRILKDLQREHKITWEHMSALGRSMRSRKRHDIAARPVVAQRFDAAKAKLAEIEAQITPLLRG